MRRQKRGPRAQDDRISLAELTLAAVGAFALENHAGARSLCDEFVVFVGDGAFDVGSALATLDDLGFGGKLR